VRGDGISGALLLSGPPPKPPVPPKPWDTKAITAEFDNVSTEGPIIASLFTILSRTILTSINARTKMTQS
jgi:hypothetical protein